MGKKSLIKSTAKKKSEAKKEEKTTQKAAAKKTTKAPAKAAKKTTAPKAKTTAASKTASPATQTKKSKSASKKLSRQELLFLKFETPQPAAKKLAAPKPAAAQPTAPPLITSTDPKEVERLRTLIAKKFSLADIKASARAPEPRAEPETEPVKATASESGQPAGQDPTPKPAVIKNGEQTAKPVNGNAPEPRAPKPAEEAAHITFEPAVEEKKPQEGDPVSRSIKLAAAAAALVILIMLAVSASNSSKYYINPTDNAIEIWKGDFSPKDKSFFMVLHGTRISEPLKEIYSKKEVFPIIFNHYVDKSDTLLEVKDLPDFEGIKKYLRLAKKYAVTNEMETVVNDRLNTIERMTLLYKADVAISRNTVASLESAVKILKEAGGLSPSALQAEEIAQKLAAAREGIASLKSKAAAIQPQSEDEDMQAGGQSNEEEKIQK